MTISNALQYASTADYGVGDIGEIRGTREVLEQVLCGGRLYFVSSGDE